MSDSEFKGQVRRQIKAIRRGLVIEPFVTITWMRSGGVVSAAASFLDASGGGVCMVSAMVHGKIGGMLHNSVTESGAQARGVLEGDFAGWFTEAGEEATWTEAAIRLVAQALVEKIEAPSRLTETKVHPWLREGELHYKEKFGT